MRCHTKWIALSTAVAGLIAAGISGAFAAVPPALLANQVDGFFIAQDGTQIARQQTNTSHDYFEALKAVQIPTGGFVDAVVLIPGDEAPGSGESPADCSVPSGSFLGLGGCSDAIAVMRDADDQHLDVFMLSEGATVGPGSETQSFIDATARITNYVLGPVESGQWQDITSLFGNAGADPSFAVYFQSDSIPEPPSLALLATTLAGFAALRRRRRG